VHTYKARLVTNGYTQLYEVDYEETFSPVADIRAIKILISIAAFYDYKIWQMDVKTVFLNSYLDEDIYMVQPEGFVDPKHPRNVCKLQRSIYGLKQATRIWNKGKAAFILGIKIYIDRSKRLIELSQSAYMDKILKGYWMDNSKRGYIPMQERLDLNKTQGALTPEEVKRMQNVPYASTIGSIMYARNENRDAENESRIKTLETDHDNEGHAFRLELTEPATRLHHLRHFTTKSVNHPSAGPRYVLSKRGKLNPRHIGPFKILAKVGVVAYRLELLDQLSRVYSTFHVSNLKKCLPDKTLGIPLDEIQIDDKLYFVEEPVEIMDRKVKRLKQSRLHYVKAPFGGVTTAVKIILKYLRNTKDMFLVYDRNPKAELRVDCYCDAGFVTDRDDTKSQTRYVFVLNGGAVDWKSSKESTTVMSATEAEYIATSEAEMEAVWIRKFISRLGIVPTINEPIKMICDNSAALHFPNEPGVQKGARHYHRRYHYVRESIKLGEIKFLKVHTDDNLADPFMKALSKEKLTQHARSMGLRLASSFM
ncbi:retrotransposon protein, putative, ty1-copia subclass, partial [Tanacetum coccineum]